MGRGSLARGQVHCNTSAWAVSTWPPWQNPALLPCLSEQNFQIGDSELSKMRSLGGHVAPNSVSDSHLEHNIAVSLIELAM